jgi:hypothetical protein
MYHVKIATSLSHLPELTGKLKKPLYTPSVTEGLNI